MPHSVPHHGDHTTLKYIVTHVFLPLQLPDGDDHNILNDHALSGAIASAAHLFCGHLDEAKVSQWHAIVRMLDNLHVTVQFESLDESGTISQLSSMNVGDVRAFLIRAQNVAIIFRKQEDVTTYESFEVSPKAEDVISSRGKLICSYPGPSIEIPNAVFNDEGFLSELVNFLVHMNQDVLDAAPTSQKAQSTLLETRDTTHPRYVTELLTGILRSIGCPADIARISKRVGDDVVWNKSQLPWRRSSLWLLIRVALQTSLERSTLGHHTYKAFMLFFMCYLAKEDIYAQLPNHLLHAMSAKISRRLRKLGSFAPAWLSRAVLQTCTSLRSILDDRWRHVHDFQRISPLWAPSQLNLAQDIQLSLLTSGGHLCNALANQSITSPVTRFNPDHRSRGALCKFLSSDGAFFEEAYRAEPHVALYDVERGVEQGIDAWVSRITNNNEACVKLEILASKYSSSALKTYGSNPELLSVMLLTTIELWVALDKLAIKEIPMLADYSPEVPASLLEDLLFCKKGSLHRLRYTYQYLSRRHSSSKSGWSVFSSTITEDSFSVRFYRTSSNLQRLKAQIENAARVQVAEKVAELERANDRYAELRRMAAEIDHEYAMQRRKGRHKKKRCSKCRYEDELQSMQIKVHEWPLPVQQLDAEAVVFELDCPVSFNMWRAATFHLLVNLCTPPMDPKPPYIQLHDYTALRPSFVQHPRSRITLASDTKPFADTHYTKTSIPTTQERVCVNNGLKFYGFDSHTNIPISEAFGHVDIRRYCTYQLPSGSYQNLQNYVDATSHTSNEVVANQANCHKDLSIHEFMAFGHLRCGSLLQWFNILRELRGRSLSLYREAVHLLLAQAVSQVGPLSDTEWTWHEAIRHPPFCYALLEELEGLMQDVEANWLEAVTMDTISFLVRRLLASCPNEAISLKALGLLRTVRCKVFSWIQDLADKLMVAPEDEELRGFLRDAAVICRCTLDVDPTMIPKLLHTAEDFKAVLSSALLIHQHTPANVSSLPLYSQLLLDRNRRVSLTLESVIRDAIQADPSHQGINLAVGWVWPDYRSKSKWIPLREPNSRWLSCGTAVTAKQSSQVVHFNLLDGSLLVGGKSLGRLPSDIQGHPLYDFVFGKQVLDVIPGDLVGMGYSTRGRISNHQVYFCLRDKELVIQAMYMGNSEIIELIPREKLEGDLPAVLVEGHAHWLNLSTSIMEIRPLDSLWKSSPGNWRIDCTPGRYRMYRGHEFLIDTRSKSWDMVSCLLKPLDTPQNLIVTVSPINSNQPSSSLQLSVVLPRYGLSFYVDEDGDLQSRNIRDMVYDENQSVGTLFGLVNQLVLRPKLRMDIDAELVSRCVLIPEGEVSFRTDSHHVCVEINTCGPALQRVTYQTYRINTDLGCLTENAGLTNKLFCAYLHALTSGCGADPLTGRSGTEEALSLLQSASCWSILRFSSRDAELVRSIASICSSRRWYPKHLNGMQRVVWLDLPVNSQHHGLYLVCKAIKEHYEKIQIFQEGELKTSFEGFPVLDEHLLERNARRVAYLFPSDLSPQPSSPNVDVRYHSRDLVEVDSGEHRAYVAATVVSRRTADSTIQKDVVLKLLKSWKEIISGNTTLSLQYDRSWLAPDFSSIWLEAYNLLRRSNESKWFQLLFSLPAMAYASPELSDLVPALVAFAVDSRFCSEDPPHYDIYDLAKGYQPSPNTLRSYVFDCAHAFRCSPESAKPAEMDESPKDLQQRQLKMYNDRRKADADTAIERWSDPWPCGTPPSCSLNPELYDVAKLTSDVEKLFATCYDNFKLKEHFTRVQEILNNVYSKSSRTAALPYSVKPSQSAACCVWSLTVDQLFMRPAPSLPVHDELPRSTPDVQDINTSLSGHAPLHQLITTVEETAGNSFQGRYASSLRASADYYGSEVSLGSTGATGLPSTGTLQAHYAQCNSDYIKSLQLIREHLGPSTQSEQALEYSGQWPRFTAHRLFRCLASGSPLVLSDDWKRCLTRLALLKLSLQRARRLLRLHLSNLHEELWRELENEGCDGWNPDVHPDWLLIQLQGNFLVRRVQADVANEMIAPRSGSNTAMQLNMGEGKSSVIVPIVVVNLADGDQLVRVIVPKALTAQMFHLLADRLGGLVNRRVYFIPFSRFLKVDRRQVATLHGIMSECMKERGILVVQPEHVLSLRLVSVEKQLPEEKGAQLAGPLLNLQKWLHSHSRDILDESDEILHVRYQLVYTIGLQHHMEGFPERWTTTQQVLGLVNRHAASLRMLFPLGVEHERGPSGSFPRLRILHADAGLELISWIVQDVVDGLLPDFSFGQFHSSIGNAIRTFISCEHVPLNDLRLVQKYSQETPLWNGLLLLRGLLATGILSYAFRERRWRVDYGLAPTRTMLAVPYRAKDVPAQRAEFGHPDVAIILTCLSYYYGGLSEEQLRLSFDILLKQDDPTLDYDLWVRDRPDIPACLRTLSGINTKSLEQWNTLLFPLFSQNKATVDFYLLSVVFPKEAKEFPSKLCCSGWDLAEKKERLVTGFSGTNDGQYLLPLHITQHDPDHQRGTNAKVLSYLLQQENNHYMCMTHENGKRRTTHEFLHILVVQKPEIRVLLDVGAQMLDLQNDELAEAWLDINHDASAAIYFSEDDELTVRTRDGTKQLFLSSPFAQQLDQCVVYLDDAHTRGTDIKFPSGFRAAVTLGPKVTKDRLTQGCMRMRKLGHSHSIIFFAPLEVDQHIRAIAGKDKDPLHVIETKDILHWAIRETCEEIQQRAPHWAQQGMDHASRYTAWASFCSSELTPEVLSRKWLQPEAKKLEELYGPRDDSNSTVWAAPDIRQRCAELGFLSLRDNGMDEEQEREVVHEMERERQVERPPKVPPATHSVHPDVVTLVETGDIPTSTVAFRPVFETLDATSAAPDEAHVWSSYVLATTDFEKTVSSSGKSDEYMRPVQWILSTKRDNNETLVILSPYEVNQLIPRIRSSKHVHLHLYTPCITRSMRPCDDLALYSIPTVPTGWMSPAPLMDQLNVFAGQLYLQDYETYIRLCRFLCVYTRDLQDEEGLEVGCDGFISPATRPMRLRSQTMDTFQYSPMNSLRTLTSFRRKGIRFALTHMGKLFDGRLLSESDFDNSDHATNGVLAKDTVMIVD